MGKDVVRVQVRLASKSDLDYCVDLAARTLDAGTAVYDYFNGDSYFVFLTDGGFGAVMVNYDTADLLDIAVEPELRKKGIGSALMQFMIDECISRGVKEIFLEVRTTNTGATSLYKKFGFEQISIRKNYYSAPVCDGCVMRKTL